LNYRYPHHHLLFLSSIFLEILNLGSNRHLYGYAVRVSIAGFATNIYFLLSARAIQRIGIAIFPIAFSIIRDNFPSQQNRCTDDLMISCYSCFMTTLVVSLTLSIIFCWEVMRPTMLTGEAGTILESLLIGVEP